MRQLRSLVAMLAMACSLPAFAATIRSGGGGGGGGGSLLTTTVSGLPSCGSSNKGTSYTLTDCTAVNDCSSGGGTATEIVICNGSAWAVQGDGTAVPGAVVFTDVGAGTNANALVVGAGGSITPSSTGTVNATALTPTGTEKNLLYDTTMNCWYIDDDDGSDHDQTSAEQCIGDSMGNSSIKAVCRPEAMPAGSTVTAGIQECITALEAIGGGTVRLGPGVHDLTGSVPVVLDGDDADEITIEGSGEGSTNIECVTAAGCTAKAVIDVLADRHTIRNLWVHADLGATAIDGIRIGEPDTAQCTAPGVPATCCTGAGAGTCTSGGLDYPRDTTIDGILLSGNNTNRPGVGIRHFGLGTTIENSVIKWWGTAVKLGGQLGGGTSNLITLRDNDITLSNVGVLTTSGNYQAAQFADWGVLNINENTFESIRTYGISLTGNSANGGPSLARANIKGNHFEVMDTGVYMDGQAAGDSNDPDILSEGNFYTGTYDGNATQCTGDGTATHPTYGSVLMPCCTAASTGATCDADSIGSAIVTDADTDNTVTSIADTTFVIACINLQGTGKLLYIGAPEDDNPCVPTLASGVAIVDMNTIAGTGATDEYCLTWEDTGKTLVWQACAAGTGDVTAVGPMYSTGDAFVDAVTTSGTEFLTIEGTGNDGNEAHFLIPSANPAADISWTFPTTTGNLVGTGDTGTVTSTMISNNTVDVADIATDLAWADGDSLDFSGITLSTTGEGLILTSPADCDTITGISTGTLCYDTTDDSICVYDGAAMDCQSLGAAGTGDVTAVGDCTTGACFTTAGSGTNLFTDSDLVIDLDNNNDGTNAFIIQESATEAVIFQVTEAGNITLPSAATITIPGNATDGQFMSLFEDTTFGTNSWSLDLEQSDLAATVAVLVTPDGGLDFTNGSMQGKLIATEYNSETATASSTGAFNMANAETLCWESSPASTDVCITATSGEVIDATGGTFNAADVDGTFPATAAAATAAADTNTTVLATTAFVQQEINGSGGAGLSCSSGTCATASSEASFIGSGTAAPTNDGAILLDTDGDASTITNDVVIVQNGSEDFIIPTVREYPTTNGQILKYNSTNHDLEWATDADTGGAPALSGVTNPTADSTLAFDAAEQLDWSGTGNFSEDLFEFTQETGNPTAGSVVVVNVADADASPTVRIENTGAANVAIGLQILGSSTGDFTTGIDLSDADVPTALALGSNQLTVGGATLTATEFARLDGKDAALIDVNDSPTLTGSWDFNGGTGLIPPTGAPNVTGELALDATNYQLQIFDGSNVQAFERTEKECMTIETPADTDSFLLFFTNRAITVDRIQCIIDPADTGESVGMTIQECNGTADSCGTTDALTCDNDADNQTTITDSAIDADDYVNVDIGTVTGTVTQVNVCVYYRVNPT